MSDDAKETTARVRSVRIVRARGLVVAKRVIVIDEQRRMTPVAHHSSGESK